MRGALRQTLGSRLLVPAILGIAVVAGVWACRGRGGQERPDARLGAAIAEVEAGRRSTPLIGEPAADGSATVTFLARSDRGKPPRVVSDVTGWGESIDGSFDFSAGTMRRVEGTDWYSLEAKVAARSRVEYLFSYGQSDYRPDPRNPRDSGGPAFGGAPASEFVMPGYQPPQEFVDPPASPAGGLHEHPFDSRALRRRCSVTVYTPPGYHRDGNYPVAVFVDSGPRRMPRVLDWLIGRGSIAPVVAVFAFSDSVDRDQPTRTGMRAFITEELPRWLARRYGVTRDARERAVLGISFGARDALDIAVSSPDTFGLLGLLIPGRRIGREDIDAIAADCSHRLRVAILAGQYDRANLPTARSVRQAMVAAGHSVDHIEVPEGHSAVTFHHHLREVLVSLFGAGGPG